MLSSDGEIENNSDVYLLLETFKELVSKHKLEVETVETCLKIFEVFGDILFLVPAVEDAVPKVSE